VNLSAWTSSTRARFDFDGVERPLDDGMRFEERAFAGYTAVGLAPGVELNASVLVKVLELDQAEGSLRTTGLADLVVGLKLGLGGEDLVRSAQLSVKVPTGYEDDVTLPLGDGQIDLELRAMLGASLWRLDLPGYVGLEVGYRHRGGSPGDVLAAMGELGVNVFDEAGVRLKLESMSAIDLPRETTTDRALFAYDSRLTRLDAAVWLGIGDVATVEVARVVVLDARNHTGGDPWRVSLSRTFVVTP
jgi:hypothetical protein